jgi:hypothetical protein
MKKPRLTLIKNPNPPISDALDLTQMSEEIERRVSARLRDPKRSVPTGNIFAVNPDIDAPTLLAYASQNLASVKAMSTDLVAQLEGLHRSKALAIQRLAVLAELSVNQVLKNIGSRESRIKPV